MRWLLVVSILLVAAVPSRAFAESAQPPLIVVEIGGVGTEARPGAPWSVLQPYLGGVVDFRPFEYDTCGDVSANTRLLVDYLQTLRQSRVVLAGHSMGGVLALNAAA